MSGYHSFSIQNTSDEVRQYNISMKLCADNSNCMYDSRTYNVSSRGSFSNNATTSLVANTSISGDASSNEVSTATIIVTK